MMKKLLVLNGSPREGGYSAQMAECFLSVLDGWEAEIIRPYACALNPCVDCRFCHKEGACCIDDGMGPLYPKIDAADGFLIASPIYFFSFPSPLKMLIDRLQPYWCRRILHGKLPPKRLGALLLAGGAPPHEGQFFHGEALARGVFRELGAETLGSVCFSESDRRPIDEEIKEEIRALAKRFK